MYYKILQRKSNKVRLVQQRNKLISIYSHQTVPSVNVLLFRESVRLKKQNISHWNFKYTNTWAPEPSVECTSVDVGVSAELSQLVALSVVVQHPETLVTEHARVAGGKLVAGGEPPRRDDGWALTVGYCWSRFVPTCRWRRGRRHTSESEICVCVWGVDTASCPSSRDRGPAWNTWRNN